MRILLISSLFALLVLAVYGWDKYDHEIFDLVGEIEATEGKGASFYSILGVESTASAAEIGKAYKRKSLLLHPDKNPGVKGIHERFARLGVISTILRNEEGRKRYDFFYKNGVPRWRGTGYYYSRFRPGLGTVITFLIIFTSGIQYIIQHVNYKSDLARIQLFVNKARLAAWGPKLARIEGKRKVKVNVGGATYVDDDGEEIISNGKWVEMVVEGDDVYILEPDGQLLPLDNSVASAPSLGRTWFYILVKMLYGSIRRYWTPTTGTKDDEDDNIDVESSDSAKGSNEGGTRPPLQGRPAVISGGRRRPGKKRR